ncbi:MAG: DUF881 domain-containing protein [Armatimonadota bacterium]|nr:DUF881 domain-containing protein [Armatimonadota bacterium]
MAKLTNTNLPQWIAPVSSIALVFGFLIAAAMQLPADPAVSSLYGVRASAPPPQPIGSGIDERDSEIKRLRDQITELQDAMSNKSKQTEVLNNNLQEVKLFAGLTEVSGPGIEIFMRDSKQKSDDPEVVNQFNVHDRDVLVVVNDLWMSGAEAISVNGHRLAKNTNFRCEGPVIYVGRVPIASPVKISAIGDADTLYGAMTMQGRYLDNIKKTDPYMVEVNKKDKVTLQGYTGSTESSFAKTVAAKQ